MFEGSSVALVTPFKDAKVDEAKLAELIEFQIANGTSAIVPCGTTGESPTLSHEEHDLVVAKTVEIVNKRIKVIAGAGSNSTAEAVRLTKSAKAAGADAVLSVVPYYNKPTQGGLIAHFTACADVEIPVVLYNIPGRSAVALDLASTVTLSKHPYIAAMKEATGSADNVSYLSNETDLEVLSGDDSLTLPFMACGAIGVVSVIANLIPAEMAKLAAAANSGDFKTAREIHSKIFPLCRAMFLETNPIPIKTAMKINGQINGEMRLPLVDMLAENEALLKDALKKYGI